MNKILEKNNLDILVVSNLKNIRYLSGFKGSNALLIFNKNKKYLVTDMRYFEGEKKRKSGFEVLKFSDDKWKNVMNFGKNIGIESDNFTLEKFENRKKVFPSKKWVKLKEICKEKREVKSKEEIEKMKFVASLAEKALEKTIKEIKEGISEKEIAWILEKNGREMSADKLSFDTIVAFGKNSNLPHHKTGETKLKKGDVILIDFGFEKDGYTSDCTRTFLTEKNEKIEKIYNLVLKAQEESLQNVREGLEINRLFNIANNIFKKEKLEKYFLHSLGHGIGLEVHESPTVYEKNKNILKEGMAITIEPGLYLDNFGIRIEDTIIVTKNGFENLYTFNKKLQILDI